MLLPVAEILLTDHLAGHRGDRRIGLGARGDQPQMLRAGDRVRVSGAELGPPHAAQRHFAQCDCDGLARGAYRIGRTDTDNTFAAPMKSAA